VTVVGERSNDGTTEHGENALAPEIEVLFPEAKRRERNRRFMGLATVFVLGGLIAGLIVAFGGAPPSRSNATAGAGGGGSLAVSPTGTARVATVDLTGSDKYSEIAVVNDRILLYGSTIQSSDVEVADTCYSASVNPSSLVLSDKHSGSCANPAREGRRVLPVFATDKDLPASGGGASAVVRIAHVVSQSPGYALGPIVMTFPALAWGDSEPTWIYGGGDLWLYEWDNPGGVDLMRISATTGAVLQRLTVPKIWHAILAYNDDGLWLAPSGQTSGPPSVLYRVALGGSQAIPVFHFARDGFAKWIVASGDDVWVNAQPRQVSDIGEVWMLRGPQAKPVWHVRESAKLVQVFETLGQSGMTGDGADGLWASSPTAYDTQQITRVAPTSGALRIEATWKAGYLGSATYLYESPLMSWTGVTLAGSFFVLDPPIPSPSIEYGTETVGRFSALYRITPSD
jgi:hypothetical protein